MTSLEHALRTDPLLSHAVCAVLADLPDAEPRAQGAAVIECMTRVFDGKYESITRLSDMFVGRVCAAHVVRVEERAAAASQGPHSDNSHISRISHISYYYHSKECK